MSGSPSTGQEFIFEEEGSLMSEERLTMLKLRFDESDFGVMGSTPSSTFSAPAFVRSKAEYFSYEELEEDLQLYSEHLERRILRHIHDDVHEAFISVAAHMEGVRGPLTGVLVPSQSIQRRLEGCVSGIHSIKEEVTHHLHEATAHGAEEDACNAEIRCLVLYQRACSILGQIDEARGASVRHIQLLDELCVVVRGFRGSAAVACAGSNDRNSDEIKGLFSAAEGALRACLSDSLGRQLQQYGDSGRALVANLDTLAELQPLLDIFVEYGEVSTLVSALKDIVLRPRLEVSLSWSAVHEARKNPSTTSGLFVKLIEQLSTFVVPLVGILHLWTEQGGLGSEPIYPVLDIVWPAVSEIIHKRFSGLLNPAMPEVFQASFVACEGVVNLLASVCDSAAERASFQQQTQSTEDGAGGRWAVTWQRHLSVYKSVVHNDALASTKKCMPVASLAVVVSKEGSPYRFEVACKGVVAAMEHLLSEGVFIRQIGADLLHEAALVAMRGVEGIVNTLAAEGCTVQATKDGAALPRAHALAMLANDLRELQQHVAGPFASRAVTALQLPREGGIDAILSTIDRVISKAIHYVVGQCVGDIGASSSSAFAVGSQQMVSRIGSNPAFTTATTPLSTSGYVTTVTDQVSEFLRGIRQYCSASTAAIIVSTAVGGNMVTAVQKTAAECIRTAARRQEVIARRKKKSDDEPLSIDDVDKIIVQLYVDLQAIHDHPDVAPHLTPDGSYGVMMTPLTLRAAWVCAHKMSPSVRDGSPILNTLSREAPSQCPSLWGIE